MKIKIIDAKIKKLRHQCDVARKVMENMDVEGPSETEGEAELAAMTKPNREKIQAVLDDVQGRAKVRRLSLYDITEAAETAERMLDEREVPTKFRKGCRFEVNAHNGNVPRSYKYPFSNSSAIIERGADKAWFFVAAYRDSDICGCNIEDRLLFSTAARKHAVRSLHEELVEGIAA